MYQLSRRLTCHVTRVIPRAFHAQALRPYTCAPAFRRPRRAYHTATCAPSDPPSVAPGDPLAYDTNPTMLTSGRSSRVGHRMSPQTLKQEASSRPREPIARVHRPCLPAPAPHLRSIQSMLSVAPASTRAPSGAGTRRTQLGPLLADRALRAAARPVAGSLSRRARRALRFARPRG